MSSIVIQGDTSGSITVEAPSVAGTHTLTLPKATGNIATDATVGLGTKNLIINGDMRIAQRGTSVTGLTNGDSGYYTVDRWLFTEGGTSTAVFTQSQDTDVPSGQGFASSLKMACTTAHGSLAANDAIYINQKFEGQNLQHLKYGTSSAESFTISFWVKSNKTGTYTVSFYNNDNARGNAKSYTIDTADTWEKKTITIDGDTVDGFDNDNLYSLNIYFVLCAGTDWTSGTFANGTWEDYVKANFFSSSQVNLADSTSNYWQITGVQLEVGENATPFENRMYSQELAMCQRYYYQIDYSGSQTFIGVGIWDSTTNGRVHVPFKTTMRATPTLNSSASSGNLALAESGVALRASTSHTSLYANEQSMLTRINVASSGSTQGEGTLAYLNGAGAYISFDAEL